MAFEVATFGLVGIALMSPLMVGRHTRGEEESGRAELVRAGPLGRYAGVASPVLVVAEMNVAVGAAIALGLLALGLPAPGSLVLEASLAAVGLVFAGVTALAAQAAAATRAANALSGAALAVAFALRAVGDMGSGSLSWLSPLGWAQSSRPFAGERWWPLVLAAGVAGGCLVIAGALSARRDLGAGLIAPRPGAPTASRTLGRLSASRCGSSAPASSPGRRRSSWGAWPWAPWGGMWTSSSPRTRAPPTCWPRAAGGAWSTPSSPPSSS